MRDDKTCRAIQRDGKRCPHPARFAGFCGKHFPKQPEGKHGGLREHLKTAGEIIAFAGGAAQLVEEIVKLWQSLPWGESPSMPSDFTELRGRLPRLIHLAMPRRMIAFNKGPNSVDWKKARDIHDASRDALELLRAGPSTDIVASRLGSIENELNTLLDTMDPSFRQMLLESLDDMGAGS
jgi:hypothetical protein